jgi:hypothetical protein
MQNPDGTATCDRCGILLPGFGVLQGMVCASLTGDTVTERIFCYRNGCRTTTLGALVGNTNPNVCTHCAVPISPRAVAYALLASDIDPTVPGGVQRMMQFCYINDSAGILLRQGAM